MIAFLSLATAVSFAISLGMTALMIRLSLRLRLVAQPGGRRIHERPIPKGGGMGIFLGMWIPVGIATAFCWYLAATGAHVAAWRELDIHVMGVASLTGRLGIIFLGSLVIWLLGLADDRWDISPWIRLAVETGVALMLVLSGLNVSLFVESAFTRGVITVVWVVCLINAFNMLDNMDGLSAGVATIIAAFFCIVAFQTGHVFIGAFLSCLIGAIAGFLIFNFPPASIFMGDSGSTTIGYLLAVMTVEHTFFQAERPYFPIVMPLMMFGLPLFDMVTVVWIRLRSGRSPFRGDTNHFSHRLVALGMSRRQAVLAIYLVTATVALGATVLYYASSTAILVIFAQTIAIFTIIGILESARPDKTREQ